MAQNVRSIHWQIKHRVTGLFCPGGPRTDVPYESGGPQWSRRGKVWRTRRAVLRYIKSFPEIPREWLLVPIEMIVRNDRAVSARVYMEMWNKAGFDPSLLST